MKTFVNLDSDKDLNNTTKLLCQSIIDNAINMVNMSFEEREAKLSIYNFNNEYFHNSNDGITKLRSFKNNQYGNIIDCLKKMNVSLG